MATRFSEARAKHLKEATEMERADVGAREEHVSGVVSLSSEERDMRNAGRRLASEEDDNLDVVGTLKHLMDVIEKGQVNTNELTKRLDEVVADLRAVTDELRVVQTNVRNEGQHAAQQAAIMGVGKAQHDAEEAAIRGINETTKQSQASIKKAVDRTKDGEIEAAAVVPEDFEVPFGKARIRLAHTGVEEAYRAAGAHHPAGQALPRSPMGRGDTRTLHLEPCRMADGGVEHSDIDGFVS